MPSSNFESFYNDLVAYYDQQRDNSSTNNTNFHRIVGGVGLFEQIEAAFKKEYNKLIKKDNIIYPDE